MTLLLYVGTGLLGLAIGSFLNVVIHRLPRGESLSRPPSHCPSCGAQIRNRHNVPVLGWLMLRGRCADCAAPISVRYPAVELVTGVLFVAVAVRFDRLAQLPALPAYLYFAAIGVALAAIDFDLHRLPNRIVLPSYPVLGALLVAAALASGDGWQLARGLPRGRRSCSASLLALALAYPRRHGVRGRQAGRPARPGGLGYLSWAALAVGAFAGFLLGAVVGVGLIAAGRSTRSSPIPFGPFLIAGALIGVFAGDALLDLVPGDLTPSWRSPRPA